MKSKLIISSSTNALFLFKFQGSNFQTNFPKFLTGWYSHIILSIWDQLSGEILEPLFHNPFSLSGLINVWASIQSSFECHNFFFTFNRETPIIINCPYLNHKHKL